MLRMLKYILPQNELDQRACTIERATGLSPTELANVYVREPKLMSQFLPVTTP
jgi:hypothetical protein